VREFGFPLAVHIPTDRQTDKQTNKQTSVLPFLYIEKKKGLEDKPEKPEQEEVVFFTGGGNFLHKMPSFFHIKTSSKTSMPVFIKYLVLAKFYLVKNV